MTPPWLGALAEALRRRLRLILFALLGLLFLLGAWAFLIEPARLVVRETAIEVPAWPAGLRGLRIALITDLHAGSPFITVDKIHQVVALTNAAHPDLILLAGDFTMGIRRNLGGRFVAPETIARALAGLHAPCGVFATLGNHDRWLDGPRVRKALEEVGMTVLENDAVEVRRDRSPLWIAGISDLWTATPDIPGTLAKVTDSAPVIAFTHNPDIFPDMPARVSLTIAGHTHGGQVVLPLLGRPIVPSKFGQRYAIGHIIEGGRQLFVSSGIGTSIIPVRFGVPPEISVLTID